MPDDKIIEEFVKEVLASVEAFGLKEELTAAALLPVACHYAREAKISKGLVIAKVSDFMEVE